MFNGCMVSVDYSFYIVIDGTQNERNISDYILDKSLNIILLEFMSNIFYMLFFSILIFQYLVAYTVITVNV